MKLKQRTNESTMKLYIESNEGWIEEEVESIEEGRRIATPAGDMSWRIEDEQGNVLDSSDSKE